MNITKLRLFLASLALVWLIVSVVVLWLGQQTNEHLLYYSTMISGVFFLPGSFVLIGYTIYLIQTVVPKVDKLVEPDLCDILDSRGDDWLHKFHRLVIYSLSAMSDQLNRRDHPNCDFDQLPTTLTTPLRVFIVWLILTVLSMIVGFSSIKLGQVIGVDI